MLVSFVWGAVMFQEKIQDWPLALLALFLMTSGMMGMAFSIRGDSNHDEQGSRQGSKQDENRKVITGNYYSTNGDLTMAATIATTVVSTNPLPSDAIEEKQRLLPDADPTHSGDHMKRRKLLGIAIASTIGRNDKLQESNFNRHCLKGFPLVFLGISNGSIMVPFHYAPPVRMMVSCPGVFPSCCCPRDFELTNHLYCVLNVLLSQEARGWFTVV